MPGTGNVAAIGLNGSVLAPGGSPGTLAATGLVWNAGGRADFQLGGTSGSSDRLVLSGALTRGTGDSFRFRFSDASGAPQPGHAYTLITFASVNGFSASDFSYDYTGAGTLQGRFVLDAMSLRFVLDRPALSASLSDFRTYCATGRCSTTC